MKATESLMDENFLIVLSGVFFELETKKFELEFENQINKNQVNIIKLLDASASFFMVLTISNMRNL